MPRHKRDLYRINMNVPTSLMNEIIERSESMGMNRTDAICLFIQRGLEVENDKGKTAEKVNSK